MIDDYALLSSFTKKEGGQVTFGDNSKGNILGIGNVRCSSSPLIENVHLLDNLINNCVTKDIIYSV